MIAPVDIIGAFCAYHHQYNAISPARAKMQTRVLRDLEAFLPGPVLELDSDQLRDYATQLVSARSLHPNTVRQYLGAIGPLITWMWDRKLINAETFLALRAVDPPRGASANGVPRPYSRKEFDRFRVQLEAAYPWGVLPRKPNDGGRQLMTQADAERFLSRFARGLSRWNRVQCYAKRVQLEAIVALAMYGALRRDEIFNVKLNELHPDNAFIVVRSRKNPEAEERVRAVPWMSNEMRDSVRRWLDLRELLAPEHDSPWLSLHQSHYLKPMRHRQFGMLVCMIGEGWSFHRMRHTAATHMLRAGIPLEKVAPILGHSRLEQTRAYAKIDHTDVVLAAARVQGVFGRGFAHEEREAA